MKPDETGDGKPRKKPGRKPKPPEKPPETAGEMDAVEPAPDVLPDDFFQSPKVDATKVAGSVVRVVAAAADILDEQERAHIERQKKRAVMATEVARHCWNIACGPHRLESGDPLAFDDYPFQPDMFRDDAPEQVYMGSTQHGKPLRWSTPVRMHDGSARAIASIVVGDLVATPGGRGAYVTGVFPQGRLPLWRITLKDGRYADACDSHPWPDGCGGVVRTTELRMRLAATQQPHHREEVVLPVAEGLGQAIASIEPCGTDEAVCISIHSADKLYVLGNGMISHNTERLICYAIACAVAGLKVMFICSKEDARERLVKTRIDPALRSVPQYRRLVAQAQAKGKSTDSARIKQIGAGSINFANAQSRDQMYGTPADVLIIDEYQLCNQDHLAIANNRLDGSDYYFKIIAGNPLTKGSESNQNLHYQYLQSDQKQWHVPCDHCGEAQILEWWTHVVDEEKNKGGAILSVKPMDPEWDPDGPLDMRPVCQFCKSPMNRLHPGGFWKAMNPTHPRSGRQISNIYNAKKPLRMRYDQYRLSLNSPMRVANFVNNQLGTYYEMEGSSISESMILNCTKGDSATGLAPYRMVPAGMIEWRDTDSDAA